MSGIHTFFSSIHVLLCIFMIFVILLQPGKDAGMGAALGGGAATSAFGGRGAVTFLSKITAFCATAFFLTSLGLSFVGLKASVAQGIAAPTGATATADAGTKAPEVPAAPEVIPGSEAVAPPPPAAVPVDPAVPPVNPATPEQPK
jgi:preprotein translocase subunit SecG